MSKTGHKTEIITACWTGEISMKLRNSDEER